MTAYAATTAWARVGLALGVLMLAAAAAVLRPAAAQDAPAFTLASPEELDELVGPIALYPDDLVAIVLPASTYPLQVVAAERFLEDRERDSRLEPDEEWDDSVVALLNYPEVIELLNDDLDWMYDLGAAVLNQRADVLDAIQRFRDRAYEAGNLRSDDRQTITRVDRTIAIRPADPEVIYVPYYEPEYVVVYQPAPVYYYYPRRYPVYYYPYPAHYVFDTGFFWGVRSWFSIGWHTHYLHVYDYGFHSHPYYGWRYYDPWYVRNVYVNVDVGRGYVWEPRHRYGGRPVVRGYEGRVYTADQPPRASGTTVGSTYRSRSTEGQARTVPRTATTAQGRATASTGGSTYRNRSTETGSARQEAATTRPTTTTRPPSGGGMSQARQPSVERSNTNRGTVVTREGSYRSGGGMSQAREVRTVPQANREPRGLGSAPTMSREAPRSVAPPRAEAPRAEAPRAQAPRAEAPASRAPTRGSFEAPPRSNDGGNNGGGSYRGADSGGGSSRSASGGGNSRGGERGGGGGERSHGASRRER
jgi:hypothetical protein